MKFLRAYMIYDAIWDLQQNYIMWIQNIYGVSVHIKIGMNNLRIRKM